MKEVDPPEEWTLAVDRKAGVHILTVPPGVLEILDASAGLATFLVEAQQQIEGIVEQHERPKILVSFDHVKIVNSPVLAMLVQVRNAVRAKGGQFHISGLHPMVSSVLAVTKLDKLFQPHATVDDALRAFE